ncbi:3,4-dihydroxy-2-butanone 4-phosphate synthase [uncultured Gammaproteobacteria bacterium]
MNSVVSGGRGSLAALTVATASARDADGVHDQVSPIEQIVEDARQGRMFILVDDENRENEGDLIIPAEAASAEMINFMIRYGRGLVCLALSRERVERLNLPLMARHNQSRHQTAFTLSIEAREGVSTGISAADRARTIQAAVAPKATAYDIVTPGHIFPLVARDGGVLVRAGHTEAAVDIARLAGREPAGVICEILNDDGTMARLPDLIVFARQHGLKVGTIADLIAWRRRTENLVRRLVEMPFDSRFGGRFRLLVYVDTVSGTEHVALVKGDVSTPGPVLTRMHALSVFDDLLHDRAGGRDGELQAAMAQIGTAGRGVLVLLRDTRPDAMSIKVQARLDGGGAPVPELRDYGVGAQILRDLGVRDLVLMSNRHKTIIGLEGHGLTEVGHRPITGSGVGLGTPWDTRTEEG